MPIHDKPRIKKRRKSARIFILLVCVLLIIAVILFLSIPLLFGNDTDTGGSKDSSSQPDITTTAQTTAALPTLNVELTVAAPRIYAYDTVSGRVLVSRAEHEKCSPASMTKMMTAIVAMKYCNDDDVFTVGDELSFVEKGSSSAYLQKGYKLGLSAMMDAMMLTSGNDAAYTVAANVGRKLLNNPDAGIYEILLRFIDEMNSTAKEIGALDTRFLNPDGMYVAGHYSTAYDMAIIAKKAREYPDIAASMKKPSASHKLISGQDVTYISTNQLVNPQSKNYFPGANGLKTGSLNEAGFCLAASATRDETDIIVIIMGSESNDSRFVEAKEILTKAFEQTR